MTWTDVHRRLIDFMTRGDGRSAPVRWASLISQFLLQAEQLIFTGFGLEADEGLEFNFSLSLSDPYPVFFQKSERFSGFQSDYGRLARLDAPFRFFEESQR